jgi:hypothetical protein
MTVHLRKLLLGGLACCSALAIGVAGIAQAASPHHHHHRHHHRHHAAHHSGIPQHNGGDHDADNNGGPSDGDGLV